MIDLAAIRRETGLTPVELAANLGAGQAQVSKVERQDDMLISTLADTSARSESTRTSLTFNGAKPTYKHGGLRALYPSVTKTERYTAVDDDDMRATRIPSMGCDRKSFTR